MDWLNPFSLLLLTAAYLIYRWMKNKLTYWQRRGLLVSDVGPFTNTYNIIFSKNSFADRGRQYYRFFRSKGVKHGGTYGSFTPFYIPVDLDIIKSIVQVDFQHFVDRGMYVNEKADPLSAHLFSLSGTKWKNLRHKLTPTFTSGKMKMMFETLVNCTKGLHKVMESSKGEELDIKDILGRFTTDIIGSCAFGIECNSLEQPNNEFRQKGSAFFQWNFIRNLKIFLSFSIPKIVRLLNMKVIPENISSFFIQVVKDTVEYREKNNIERKDLMQLLIQLKNKGQLVDDENVATEKISKEDNKITIEEIAAQAFVFFEAGFETSSTTMTFCLYELAKNKEIQEKLRKEILEVLEKYDGEITYDGVMEMSYLDQTINETLRKYPALPNLNRVCTREYKVPGTDLVVEKGTKLMIPVIGIHHDPEYYPEPEKFDPDRFSEENKKSRPNFSFMPFGEGPRICIGARFGMMQTKVGLIALLSRYEFSLNKRTKEPLEYEKKTFIMAAEEGIWLDCKKISQ